MQTRLDEWLSFIGLSDDMVATLNEFIGLIAPKMDFFMDRLYARIGTLDNAASLFPTPEIMAHARAKQKEHWLDTVFTGKFDATSLRTAKIIGETHFRIGVDPRLYSGAYLLLLNDVVEEISDQLSDRPADLKRYLTALNRAVFLDMGLATSVYYESLIGQLEDLSQELNLSLARAGEYRDNETGQHITRMSRMCEALALAAGCDRSWARMLRVASPLHDVGKIGIPDKILLKPGRLDPEELEIMRTHASIGADIIPNHTAMVITMARRVALTHHERWDGTGYPTGLKGEEIPLEGRIAAICDVYDALLAKRPYKKPWTPEEAQDHLRQNAGSHFDPTLVETFLRIIPEISDIQLKYENDIPE